MNSRIWTWAGLVLLLFLALFLVYPTIRLGLGTLMTPGPWQEFFSRPYYYRGLYNSVWLSTAATVGSVLIGVPLAVLVARTNLPWAGAIKVLAVISLLSPPFIGAYAWVVLLGRAGIITTALGLKQFSIYGPSGVLLVFILHHFAYVFLLTTAALGRIDPAVEEAAESLGSTTFRRLMTVTLPLCLPAIATGGLLVFVTTLSDFGTPMLIGEGMRTLPVLAYNEFLSEVGGNAGLASVSSMLMLLVALVALAVQYWLVHGRNFATPALRRPRPVRLSWTGKALAGPFAFMVTGAAALPQVVVVVSSFMKAKGPRFTGEFGLDNYQLMLDRMSGPIIRTLIYATSATLVMLVADMVMAYLLVRRPGTISRLLDGLLVLAQILPGTVLGIGLILTWSRPPFPLAGTGTILVIAYIVRRIAYTARAAAAGVRQLSPAVEEASLTLGASPLATFGRVTVPLILPAALSGALISWVSTLSELSSTIMLYTGRTTTISVLIYNQVLNNSFGPAAALGSLLTVLTLITLWLLSRWQREADLNL